MEDLGRRNGTFGPIVEMAIPMNDRVRELGKRRFPMRFTFGTAAPQS